MTTVSDITEKTSTGIFKRLFTNKLNDRNVNPEWKQRLREGKYVMMNRDGRFYSYRAFRDKYDLIHYRNPIVSNSKFIRVRLKPKGADVLGLKTTRKMWEGMSTPENKDSPIGKVIFVDI